MMKDWPDLSIAGGGANMKNINAFPPQVESEADKKRGRAVAGMYWQLKDDEALIIEFDSHNGFWMLCNMGSFRTSMDYLYRPTSYTTSRTKVDKDGKVRIVLAHDDPGYHNWMDTQKFVEGHIVYRNLQNTNTTTFSTKLVKRSQVESAMAPDSARVTKEERVALMHQRFNSVRRRYQML